MCLVYRIVWIKNFSEVLLFDVLISVAWSYLSTVSVAGGLAVWACSFSLPLLLGLLGSATRNKTHRSRLIYLISSSYVAQKRSCFLSRTANSVLMEWILIREGPLGWCVWFAIDYLQFLFRTMIFLNLRLCPSEYCFARGVADQIIDRGNS